MAIPTRKKPEWLDRAVGAIASGKSRVEAARIAGVSRQQLYNVLKTLPDWSNVRPEKAKA